jgi:predicted metal-dependent enzyme (double-stranded beta helix superfamily)
MLHLPPFFVETRVMGRHLHDLKALRDIALDYGAGAHPDLASMARELGRAIHSRSAELGESLAYLRGRARGFERWLLAERARPAVSVLAMVWPANHATPVHDHGGLWGLEVAVSGALEVQAYRRDPLSGEWNAQGRDWLGPGDATWFDGDDDYAHRCRNLSRHEAAVSLHVYGGDLAQYLAYEQADQSGRWQALPQRSAIAGRLPA